MSRAFAVESLSKKARGLIESLYLDGLPVCKIRARLKAETGEEVKPASLYRYCSRHLKNDWRVEAIRKYQSAIVELMRGYSGMSKSKIELAAFLVAILGVQHRLLTDKLDALVEEVKEIVADSKAQPSGPSKAGSLAFNRSLKNVSKPR